MERAMEGGREMEVEEERSGNGGKNIDFFYCMVLICDFGFLV